MPSSALPVSASPESRLRELGLSLPAPLQMPPGAVLPFPWVPAVINGFTDLILEVFGPERGAHARSAVGLAELPFDIPVEIEAEVVLYPDGARR